MLSLKHCSKGTLQLDPAQRAKQLADKREINNILLTKTRQTRAVDGDSRNPGVDKIKSAVKEKKATPAIPNVYKQYAQMFKEELTAKALPKHKP